MTTIITLGGVVLGEHLVLDGIEKSPGISWSAKRTLGGRQIVNAGPSLSGGRYLSLLSENHLNHTQVTAIKALEAAGHPVTLVHHRGTFNVLITGTDLSPDSPIVNPDATVNPWYTGSISLIEV